MHPERGGWDGRGGTTRHLLRFPRAKFSATPSKMVAERVNVAWSGGHLPAQITNDEALQLAADLISAVNANLKGDQ